MRVKFWGTRGSIPSPCATVLRYGGNTSCVEVCTGNTLILFDCGTGSRLLGQELVSEKRRQEGHILISHTHWDHIQGIPFFVPLFLEGWRWSIYGPKGLHQSIKEVLVGQMQYNYFPVTLDQCHAEIKYYDLIEDIFYIDDVKVTIHYLNHTALTCGFKIEAEGVTIVYACDHEPYNILHDPNKIEIKGRDAEHVEFLRDADLVIHDAQYTYDEYQARVGWGHSTHEYAIEVCKQANVKKLILTHHEPQRTDDELDRIVQKAQTQLHDDKNRLEVAAAAEGQVLMLHGEPRQLNQPLNKNKKALQVREDILEKVVLICTADPELAKLFSSHVKSAGYKSRRIANPSALQKEIRHMKPRLLFIEHNPGEIDGLKLAEDIRNALPKTSRLLSIVLLSNKKPSKAGLTPAITDWITLPCTSEYTKNKIQSWLFSSPCHWKRPRFPENELRRLEVLNSLNILDTNPEERFDRLTRIAAALFSVPIVLITFVDKNRQWFKSCFGLKKTRETPRESSFCAHVVCTGESLVVNDTLLDERFADNPMVTSDPRVRFYAGCPILVDQGVCLGAVCLIDMKPRIFDEEQYQALEDLSALVISEVLSELNKGAS